MRPNVDMTVPASALAGRGAPISPIVLIKGAGEMASAVAWRLYMANIRRICMTELTLPCACAGRSRSARQLKMAARKLKASRLAWRGLLPKSNQLGARGE